MNSSKPILILIILIVIPIFLFEYKSYTNAIDNKINLGKNFIKHSLQKSFLLKEKFFEEIHFFNTTPFNRNSLLSYLKTRPLDSSHLFLGVFRKDNFYNKGGVQKEFMKSFVKTSYFQKEFLWDQNNMLLITSEKKYVDFNPVIGINLQALLNKGKTLYPDLNFNFINTSKRPFSAFHIDVSFAGSKLREIQLSHLILLLVKIFVLASLSIIFFIYEKKRGQRNLIKEIDKLQEGLITFKNNLSITQKANKKLTSQIHYQEISHRKTENLNKLLNVRFFEQIPHPDLISSTLETILPFSSKEKHSQLSSLLKPRKLEEFNLYNLIKESQEILKAEFYKNEFELSYEGDTDLKIESDRLILLLFFTVILKKTFDVVPKKTQLQISASYIHSNLEISILIPGFGIDSENIKVKEDSFIQILYPYIAYMHWEDIATLFTSWNWSLEKTTTLYVGQKIQIKLPNINLKKNNVYSI